MDIGILPLQALRRLRISRDGHLDQSEAYDIAYDILYKIRLELRLSDSGMGGGGG